VDQQPDGAGSAAQGDLYLLRASMLPNVGEGLLSDAEQLRLDPQRQVSSGR
jgi:hypothetical protein